MALQKTNRSLLNKDEEDEKKKRSGGFMLPTYEELRAIEEKAKEDAAKATENDNFHNFSSFIIKFIYNNYISFIIFVNNTIGDIN